jgi:hypothetical protein
LTSTGTGRSLRGPDLDQGSRAGGETRTSTPTTSSASPRADAPSPTSSNSRRAAGGLRGRTTRVQHRDDHLTKLASTCRHLQRAAGLEVSTSDGVEGTTADGTSCTTLLAAGSCPRSPGVEPRYDSIQHFGLGTVDDVHRGDRGFFAGMHGRGARVWNRVLSAGRDRGLSGPDDLAGGREPDRPLEAR